MKSKTAVLIMTVLIGWMAAGCSPKQPEVSEHIIFNHYQAIGTLNQNLKDARQNSVHLLAPKGFKAAGALYEVSYALAKEGDESAARKKAHEGLLMLEQAETDAKSAGNVLKEAVQSRQKALQAGASKYFSQRLAQADRQLAEAGRLAEAGNFEDAETKEPGLIAVYRALRCDALEKSMVQMTETSSSRAAQSEAAIYAPKTLAEAQKALDRAVAIVQEDPEKFTEAEVFARQADTDFQKAYRIATMAATFEVEKYRAEDHVLWYWRQLEAINAPTNTRLDFTQENAHVVDAMKENTLSLMRSLEDARRLAAQHQEAHAKEVAQLREELAKKQSLLDRQEAAAAQSAREERERRERYAFASSLFNADEAGVYRKNEDILISAYGFDFPVGSAEIQADNFGLLNKILSAIGQFPDAKISVSGHTDSIGGAKLNQKISEIRARNVADFLINVGKIDVSRINAQGYGESQPVANNEDEAGRAKNRRIDVYIDNPADPDTVVVP